MPWPDGLHLPLELIRSWDAELLPAGTTAPGAVLPLPVDCLYSANFPMWVGTTRVSGDGAQTRVFNVDLGSGSDVLQFVRSFSGLCEDSGDVLLDDGYWIPGQELEVPNCSSGPGNWTAYRNELSGRADVEWVRHRLSAAQFWLEEWRRVRRFAPWEPFQQRLIGKTFESREDAEDAIGDVMDEYRGAGHVVPVGAVAHDIRELRMHLLATYVLSARTIGPFVARLAEAVLDLLDGPDMKDGLFHVEDDWLELLLPSIVRSATKAAGATLRRYQPYIVGPEPEPFSYRVDDYLWVSVFNDLNDDFEPKFCLNPDCRAPFTRQVGQSRHGQSRRDARACSKACADRITYLKRSGRGGRVRPL